MKREIFIVAGANGVGKTTFAKAFVKRYPYDFVNPDEILEEVTTAPGEKKKLEAGELYFHRIQALVEARKSFVIESTLSGKSLYRLILDLKEKGYTLTIIYLFLNTPELCKERIKMRVLKGGHFVPDRDVVRRFGRSKENFWYLYKNVVDRWYLIHNAGKSIVRIAMGMGLKGTYVIDNTRLFDKFSKNVIMEKWK